MGSRLEGKVAAITGSASGFGETAARLFVSEGCRVALGDIQEEAGRAVAASLGDAAVYVRCDVTSEEDVSNLVDTAVTAFGRLDIMFNNAGIVGAVGPIDTTPTAEWKATLDILLNGVFYGVKHAARVMKPQGSGSIVSMSSTAGILGGARPAHLYGGQARRGGPDQERGGRTLPVRHPRELHFAGGHGDADGSQRHHRRPVGHRGHQGGLGRGLPLEGPPRAG